MPFFLYGDCPRCAVPICRPASVMQIGALPCGFHASSATGGAWSPPHEQERPGYHDGCALRRRAKAAGRAAHRHRGRGGKGRLIHLPKQAARPVLGGRPCCGYPNFQAHAVRQRKNFGYRNRKSVPFWGLFRAPARERPTAAHFSLQLEKWGKEPAGTKVPAPPSALYPLSIHSCLPRVRGGFSHFVSISNAFRNSAVSAGRCVEQRLRLYR